MGWQWFNKSARYGGAQRFRAKAGKRPLLFWWQAFAIIIGTILLWSAFPIDAMFHETRSWQLWSTPRAAYVVIGRDEAIELIKRARAEWMSGSGVSQTPAFAMELGLDDLRTVLPAPNFLEEDAYFTDLPFSLTAETLPCQPLAISAPTLAADKSVLTSATRRSGVWLTLGESLGKAGFQATLRQEDVATAQGSARFYVEMGADGLVDHVLVMEPFAGSAQLARALARGDAKGAARGFVEVYWDVDSAEGEK